MTRLMIACALAAVASCGSSDAGDGSAGAVKVNDAGEAAVQGQYLSCTCQLRSGFVCYDPDSKTVEQLQTELDEIAGGACKCAQTKGCGDCDIPLVTKATGSPVTRNKDGTWPYDPATLVQSVAFSSPVASCPKGDG